MIISLYHRVVAKVAALFFSITLTGPCTFAEEKPVLPSPAPLVLNKGDNPDPAKRIREKAEEGDPSAQHDYACLLLYGEAGVQKNTALAIEYLDKAAQKSHVQSSSLLGFEYQKGEILPQDTEKAIHYYELSSQNGDAPATYELARLYASGAPHLKPDSQKSFDYYQKAIPLFIQNLEKETPKLPDKLAANFRLTLGNMYLEGKGTPKNEKEAFSWYMKGALQGDPLAQHQVALCYMNGTGTPKDPAESRKWFDKAGDSNNPQVALLKAISLMESEGKARAEKEFDQLAQSGDARTKAIVAEIYRTRFESPEKTFFWMKQAAESGDPDAQCAVGVLYWKATGTTWNPVQAIKWLKKAVANDQPEASKNLSTIIQSLSAIALLGLGFLIAFLFILNKLRRSKKQKAEAEAEKSQTKEKVLKKEKRC